MSREKMNEIQVSEERIGTEKKRGRRKSGTLSIMGVEILSLVVGMILLMYFNIGGTERFFSMFIDIPTLLLLLVLAAPTFLHSGLGKDFKRAFSVNEQGKNWTLSELKRMLEAVDLLRRQFVYAGVFVALAQMVVMLLSLDEPAAIGPSVSIILLAGVYVAVFALPLMPLKVEIKKRIIDYMEEE